MQHPGSMLHSKIKLLSRLFYMSGIESIPEAIPHVVDCQHRDKDHETGKHSHPIIAAEHFLLGVGQHVTPGRRRRLHAKAQVAQA